MYDGPKKRPTLEPDPDASRVVKRIFDMAEAGTGMLHIARVLNDEGIASPAGKFWSKNGIHFILRNSNQRDIFQTLCLDIISAAARAESEAQAVSAALMRTWRWHHLLRGGRGSLLSPEEQKGLLGELLVLERILLPRMDAASAVTAWRGPLGAPKDFEIARVAIEAKTRRGGPHRLSQSRRRASWTRAESTRCFCMWWSWMSLQQMPHLA